MDDDLYSTRFLHAFRVCLFGDRVNSAKKTRLIFYLKMYLSLLQAYYYIALLVLI
jgi:hypothetical protein